MSRPLTKLRIWMNAATSSEQQHLADAIGTSRAMLYQYASGHREVSAARGGEIEAVSKLMSRASKGRLPVLYRTDLVAACRACDYAQRCLGSIAIASEFPIVEALQSDQATG